MTILRSHHHALRIAALATVSVLALTSCGGGSGGSSASAKGNGESAKPAAEILRDAGAAVAKATSVHLAGHVGGASEVGLDLRLGRAGGSGTVSTNGLVITVTRIGHAAYFTGSKAFYQHFTNAAAAQLLEGKWLKVPATDSRFAAFSRLTDMRALLGQILKPNQGTVVKAGTRILHGVPVIGLLDKTHKGTLYVSATGVPYPVEVVVTGGARPGRISFDHWDDAVTLSPPAHSIDLAQLSKLGG